MAKVKESKEKVNLRGANRTKEQREYQDFIVKDYYEFFTANYLEFFKEFAANYNSDERINEDTWKVIYEFVKKSTPIANKNNEGIFLIEKLDGLKYLKNPSTLYLVREKERLSLIKKFLEQHDETKLTAATTRIQQWHKDNMLASAFYHIYMHLFLYLTETKK